MKGLKKTKNLQSHKDKKDVLDSKKDKERDKNDFRNQPAITYETFNLNNSKDKGNGK